MRRILKPLNQKPMHVTNVHCHILFFFNNRLVLGIGFSKFPMKFHVSLANEDHDQINITTNTTEAAIERERFRYTDVGRTLLHAEFFCRRIRVVILQPRLVFLNNF